MNGLRIGVVGAGVVGASCALALAREGHEVTVFDPNRPGGPHAASHGNGGWISPASILPMSSPGLWKKIPGYLLDRQGPLALRASSLPWLMPWLWRFVRAGSTWDKVRATARSLHRLLHDAPDRHREFAQWAHAGHLLHHTGLLYVYPHRGAFEADAMAWQLRRELGVSWVELEGDTLQARAPALPRAGQLGLWVPEGAWCSDPGDYVRLLLQAAQRLGAEHRQARVQGLQLQQGRCTGVLTDPGPCGFDRVLITAGIDSPQLARQAGDVLPLASERGYHVVLPHAALDLPIPIMPSDGRMANTMTPQGLRLAGQVELARPGADPDWARAGVLLAHARRTYPALNPDARRQDLSRWMGHRPSTPDGLPVIGPSPACEGLWYACGHGHVGLAAAARTALWVTQGISVSSSGTLPGDWPEFGIGRFA